jgi:adenylate cyclase
LWTPTDPTLVNQIRRSQARQEYRMAWWRLALAVLPALEAGLDPRIEAGTFAHGLIAYALFIPLVTRNRRHHPLWRWFFAAGDLVCLQIYAVQHLAGRTVLEAAFAYVAVANILILTNSLRLSPPLLWASAAGMMGGYYVLFERGMDDVRVRLGGAVLLLISAVLASMIVRNQLRLLAESRARARLRRFVSPEVADELEMRQLSLDSAVAREVTVLFVDIRGFTSRAEAMSPAESVDFLNQFFQRVTKAVFAHQGTVDKYIGDCVMALFGAPIDRPDDAPRAVRAALDILRGIDAWNRERTARGEFPVRIGIGLNTSRVVAGTVGTPQKLEYTVIGDGVNVAARVCALTKEHPAPILLTEATRLAVSEDMPFLDFGPVTLRGRSSAIRIFGLRDGTE